MSVGEAWGFGADEQLSRQILGAFAEAGGTFIDTANLYHQARSERTTVRIARSWTADRLDRPFHHNDPSRDLMPGRDGRAPGGQSPEGLHA
jgi:hypothetical protein